MFHPVHRTFWLCFFGFYLAAVGAKVVVTNSQIVSLACDDNGDEAFSAWHVITERLTRIQINLTNAEFWFDTNNATLANFQWVKLGFNVVKGLAGRREQESVLLIRDNLCKLVQLHGLGKQPLGKSFEYIAGIQLQDLFGGLVAALEQSASVLSHMEFIGDGKDFGTVSMININRFAQAFGFLDSQILELTSKRNTIKVLSKARLVPSELFEYLYVISEQVLFDVIYARSTLVTVFERMEFNVYHNSRYNLYMCTVVGYLLVVYILLYIGYIYYYHRATKLAGQKPSALSYLPF